jgi:two-component system cell cycle sensor histidine kinase/response regulator CckA
MMHSENHLSRTGVSGVGGRHGDPLTPAQVHAHLESGCPECARELDFWTRSLGALQAVRTPAPSDEVLNRALSLFDRLVPKQSPWERPESGMPATRRRTRPAALQSEAIFRLLLAQHPVPMWLCDLTTLTFLEANKAAIARYGYSRGEFLQMRITDILAPAEESGATRASAASDFALSGVARHRLKDGRVVNVELSSHTLTLSRRTVALVVAHDITEPTQAVEDLRRSEARCRALIQSAPWAICRVHSDGRLLDANPALVEMLGHDSESALKDANLPSVAFRDPNDFARLLDRCRNEVQVDGVEVEWQDKQGACLPVWLSARSVRDPDEELDSLVLIVEDAATRRDAEQHLSEAQRMEAIGRLAGGVAHHFNNMLAVITGYTELLVHGLPPGGRLHEYADETRRAADRVSSLTRQLLAFGRRQVLVPRVVDLNAHLANAEAMLRHVLGPGIALSIQGQPDLGRVEVDPNQFNQMLVEMAMNSREAMPHGGSVDVEMKNVELDEQFAVRRHGIRPGPYVRIAFSDTGVGMEEGTLAKVFEPFLTTHEPGSGTGMGLATVFGFVTHSGGCIEAASSPGRGTTFTVHLPQIQE